MGPQVNVRSPRRRVWTPLLEDAGWQLATAGSSTRRRLHPTGDRPSIACRSNRRDRRSAAALPPAELAAQIKPQTAGAKVWWIVIGNHQLRRFGSEQSSLRVQESVKKTGYVRGRTVSTAQGAPNRRQ